MNTFHLATRLLANGATYGQRTAIQYRQEGTWRELSWEALSERIRSCARALLALDVTVGERVAIFSQNSPEWTIADVAILAVRGVSVPIYATNTAKQAQYILDEAEIGVVFAGSQEQYDKVLALHRSHHPLRRIVVLDSAVDRRGEVAAVPFEAFLAEGQNADTEACLAARLQEAAVDDLATLIYTSGTTGEPKGVMLHHTCFRRAFAAHEERLEVSDRDVSLCFLPLSHVFERTWTFFALAQGMRVAYCDDTAKVVECLQQVRPTIMCAVPRFYEKMYATIFERLQGASPLKRRLFLWAIQQGEQAFLLANERQPLPSGLALRHRVAEALVLRKLRAVVGGRVRFFPCAGAPLSPQIERFFHAAGIRITCGYGLTETTATVTCHETYHLRPGTVGKALTGIEVRIGEQDEIQVQGETVTRGYYRKPAATAEAFTADGWFRTGDVGVLEGGYLTITDRIKDLMKTSVGKYVAPQLVETLIGNDLYVDQVTVIGDGRPFVTALIVPAFVPLEAHARQLGIPFTTPEALIAHPQIVQMYERRIADNTRDLAPHEQVKRFRLLSRPFTQEAGEMTPTMKLRRRAIHDRYREMIDAMYA